MISLLALNHNYKIHPFEWVFRLFMLLMLYPIVGLGIMLFVETNFWPGYVFVGCFFALMELGFYGGTFHYYLGNNPTPPRFTERWVFPFWGRQPLGVKLVGGKGE